MKPLRYYENLPVIGWTETTPETSEDRIGSLHVECAWCPTLVPFQPITGPARRRHVDGRPLCLDCSDDADQMEYDARCAEMEAHASSEREWLEGPSL